MGDCSGPPQKLKHLPRLHDILQEQRMDGRADDLTASSRRAAPENQRRRGIFATDGRHIHGTSMSGGEDLMKLALVTIVTANLEQMRTFYQELLKIEPQTYRGNYVEFALEAGTLALWRQSECEAFGLAPMRGAANHSVLIEFEVEDVEGEYARLKGLQLEWVQELTTQPWGHRAFYVRDPDGNVINVHTAVEEPSR
jgi:catechol 2,3-dioxygenase-like lactoylglutathione lyase family enzyme